MPKLIPLYDFRYALIDDEDYDQLIALKGWRVNAKGYACIQYKDKKTGKSAVILMHRIIMSAPGGMDVDHINGDRLDNRRENLRLATRSQNLQNRIKRKIGSSRYKGVVRDNRWQGTWQAFIRGKSIGTFKNELHAAVAYDLWAIHEFKEFAHTNFKVVSNH